MRNLAARQLTAFAAGAASLVLAGGCASILNPAFLNLVSTPVQDETGTVSSITLDNAPGHVPVIFVNNTRFDDNLINYFRTIGVDVERDDLRPRVRVRATIQYVNGAINVIEFLDGSDIVQGAVQLVGGTQDNPLVPTDVLENDLTNVVAVCDVAAVAPGLDIASGAVNIEVFVPAFLKVIRIVEQDLIVQRELVQVIQPQFDVLVPDQVDDNQNVITVANFDIRDAPVLATNLQCGSVVGFTITGTLRVSFVIDELGQNVPGFLVTDAASQSANPGRFEFRTAVR